jgi:glucose dehydrogenase
MTGIRSIPLGAVCVLALLQTVGAQNAALPGDWPMYRRDAAGTGHSPLAQITTANVARLVPSWTYRLQTEGAPNVNSQATPIVIGGVMYVPAGDRVVALDAATGTEKWRHVVTGGTPSRRGVGHWPG